METPRMRDQVDTLVHLDYLFQRSMFGIDIMFLFKTTQELYLERKN